MFFVIFSENNENTERPTLGIFVISPLSEEQFLYTIEL